MYENWWVEPEWALNIFPKNYSAKYELKKRNGRMEPFFRSEATAAGKVTVLHTRDLVPSWLSKHSPLRLGFHKWAFSRAMAWADVVYPQLLIPAPCAVPTPARAAPQWIRTETGRSCHCVGPTAGTQRRATKAAIDSKLHGTLTQTRGTHVPVCQWTFSQGFNTNRSGPSNSLHQIQNGQAATDIGSFNSELSSKKQGWERRNDHIRLT